MPNSAALFTKATPAEIVPENYFVPLDFENVYVNDAPLEVDLGCGDGLFLTAAASANCARNFLGIERLVGRVRSACQKIAASGVTNARVLRCEISYAVRHLLPAGSVAVFHLMFPDPWPKRRHAARRIVTDSFLTSLHDALAPDGTIRIASDQAEYIKEIERVAGQSTHFVAIAGRAESDAVSTFEKRFRSDGVEIHRLVLRKVSEVT